MSFTNTDSPPSTPDAEQISQALMHGGVVDISTTGRRSGQAHRIEIAFFNFDGHVVISGMPGPRDWYANLIANPRLIVHVKRGVRADLPGTARLITDPAERRALLTRVTRHWRRESQLDQFLASSPLIEVTFDDPRILARDSAGQPEPQN